MSKTESYIIENELLQNEAFRNALLFRLLSERVKSKTDLLEIVENQLTAITRHTASLDTKVPDELVNLSLSLREIKEKITQNL
jgi:hypothetical protein